MHAEYGIFVYTIWPLIHAAPRRARHVAAIARGPAARQGRRRAEKAHGNW